MIYVSEIAKKKLIKIMKKEGFVTNKFFVKIGLKNGGCSGLSYDLSFEKKIKNNDKIFENGEIKILINKKDYKHLIGTKLEYSDGLKGKGFYFQNPNAKKTCGCGNSFSS